MKQPIEERLKVVRSLLKSELGIREAKNALGCSRRTIERYRSSFLAAGENGLKDHRHSNNHKLTFSDQQKIISAKQKESWRSCRNLRDKFLLPVHETTVWRLLKAKGLTKQNLERVKPLLRFEAKSANEMWQTDIMGKINFPCVGTLYLVAALDDHSRFVLSGRWFKTQGKMNVFQIWYESLARWGLPEKMLQDEGTQYKAKTRLGQADYQWYAQALGIELIWAHRAQTKGKIERFWRFVQEDFVREVWQAKTLEEVNGAFKVWLAKYNYVFKSRYFGNLTHASQYQKSSRTISKVELQTLLVVEERRKVTRESTISLYGKHYFVPPGYINCHIWVKIIGNKVYFEAMGKVFWKTRLKLS